MEAGEMRRYRVRVRYRQPLQDAALIMRECGLFILFDSPQRGITPGQFAAFYAPYDESDPYDAPELLGSGVIEQ
jgi:tRNA-specific 2-thiouridylase